jgi:hypothetical protein
MEMDFETKLVVILRDDMAMWQKLNVTAFLMSGIGGTQNIIGEPYIDGSGVQYLPMARQPIMVYIADRDTMKELHTRALSKDVKMTIYAEELFKTYNDEDNRAAVAQYNTDELNLVGIGMIAKKNLIGKLTKGLSLHP